MNGPSPIERNLIGALALCILPSIAQAQYCAYIPINEDGEVAVVDTFSNTVVKRIPVVEVPIGVQLSRNSTRAYVLGFQGPFPESGVTIIDTASNTVVDTVPLAPATQNFQQIAVSPDGRRLYAVPSNGDTVAVVDTETNELIEPIVLPGDAQSNLAFTGDGAKAYVGGAAGVSVIETEANQIVLTIPSRVGSTGYVASVVQVAVSPDDSRIYALDSELTSGRPEHLRVIDARSNGVVADIDVGVDAASLVVSADGSYVYVVRPEGLLAIAAATNSVVGTIALPACRVSFVCEGAVASHHGSLLYAARASGISTVDARSNTVVASAAASLGYGALGLTPDDARLYAAARREDGDDAIVVLDTATNTVLGTIVIGYGLFDIAIGPVPGCSSGPPPAPTRTPSPRPASATSTPTLTRTPSATVTPSRTRTPSSTITPTQISTFAGDANCDAALSLEDRDATIRALFDPVARARCNADCNRDGSVTVVDVICVSEALAGAPPRTIAGQ